LARFALSSINGRDKIVAFLTREMGQLENRIAVRFA
jgi:hypothetical protein